MKKLAKDMNVLTDAELDRMMLTLEAAHAETGNKNVLNVMSIIMPSPTESFKELGASDLKLHICPCCGKSTVLMTSLLICIGCAKKKK